MPSIMRATVLAALTAVSAAADCTNSSTFTLLASSTDTTIDGQYAQLVFEGPYANNPDYVIHFTPALANASSWTLDSTISPSNLQSSGQFFEVIDGVPDSGIYFSAPPYIRSAGGQIEPGVCEVGDDQLTCTTSVNDMFEWCDEYGYLFFTNSISDGCAEVTFTTLC